MSGKKQTISVADACGRVTSVDPDDIERGLGRRSSQLSVPGTEQKVPPGILRQAKKCLELRDAAELAKQRSEAANDFLLAAMKREGVSLFVLDDPNMASPMTFRIKSADEKIAVDGYHKPHLPELGSAVG